MRKITVIKRKKKRLKMSDQLTQDVQLKEQPKWSTCIVIEPTGIIDHDELYKQFKDTVDCMQIEMHPIRPNRLIFTFNGRSPTEEVTHAIMAFIMKSSTQLKNA
jgi:hypothetical protein